jgi:phage-related protein
MVQSGRTKVKLRLQVVFYQTALGAEPVREWLHSLPVDEKKIIGVDIKTVQIGYPIGMPLVEKIESDIFELRSRLPNRIGRILFTVEDGLMILLHGFIKKTKKIPPEDLRLARRRLHQVKGQK